VAFLSDREMDKKLAASTNPVGTPIAPITTPSDNNNANTQIQNNVYGITKALTDAYPELAAAYEMLKQNNYAGFEQAVMNSSFYKNNSAIAQQRLKSKVEQPAVYADNLERFILTTKERLVKTGVKLDDLTLRSIVSNAFDKGLDENQIDRLIIQSGKVGAFGGSILGGVEALKSYASDYGVSVSKNYWDTQSSKLFAGETTAEDVQKEIRDLAKSAYPAYASYFDKNISLKSATSSTIALVSRLMDVDPNTVTVDKNPIYLELIQYVNPQTGQPEILPDYLKERKVKADKRSGYFNTPNGKGVVSSLMATTLSDMGLI
jgi:hypothetical protein